MFSNAPSQVQNEPGRIIGPIAQLFGYIIDFMFNIVYSVTVEHSLGLAIILLTIVVRFLMLPLGVKSQKSMMAMQKLNPEVEKIRAKYGSSSDPEVKQKMNVEIQSLYSKNKVNPLGGCLPLLVQMPLFFGLIYIMNQSFQYISKLQQVYYELSAAIIRIPMYTNYVVPLALPHVPQRMLDNQVLDISRVEDMSKVLNKFNLESWEILFAQIPEQYLPAILEIFNLKQSIEMFAGLNLNENSGMGWPGILIPLLAGGTMFISSWLSQQMSTSSDPKMKTQQTIMMVVMPIFMGFITIGMPAGVGVYWITSSVFQVGQQVVMNKRAGLPMFKNGPPWQKWLKTKEK
jgi:YidC/Oxa1 family membrane protein insertase